MAAELAGPMRGVASAGPNPRRRLRVVESAATPRHAVHFIASAVEAEYLQRLSGHKPRLTGGDDVARLLGPHMHGPGMRGDRLKVRRDERAAGAIAGDRLHA